MCCWLHSSSLTCSAAPDCSFMMTCVMVRCDRLPFTRYDAHLRCAARSTPPALLCPGRPAPTTRRCWSALPSCRGRWRRRRRSCRRPWRHRRRRRQSLRTACRQCLHASSIAWSAARCRTRDKLPPPVICQVIVHAAAVAERVEPSSSYCSSAGSMSLDFHSHPCRGCCHAPPVRQSPR